MLMRLLYLKILDLRVLLHGRRRLKFVPRDPFRDNGTLVAACLGVRRIIKRRRRPSRNGNKGVRSVTLRLSDRFFERGLVPPDYPTPGYTVP